MIGTANARLGQGAPTPPAELRLSKSEATVEAVSLSPLAVAGCSQISNQAVHGPPVNLS